MSDLDDVTEFVEMDVEEVHLVGEPASKYRPLMAKSKGTKMKKMKKAAIGRAILSQLDSDFAVAKAEHDARPSAATRAGLAQAGRRRVWAKLMAKERRRATSPDAIRRNQFGLGNPLFTDTNPTRIDVSGDTGRWGVDGR